MIAGTETARWESAQSYEQGYWSGVTVPELLRNCSDKHAFLHSLPEALRHELFAGKDVLEIGCGPCAISLASFYRESPPVKRLVKCEPLERMSLRTVRQETPLDAPFLEWVEAIGQHGEYLRSTGEGLDFAGSFDTAITENVLDHVQDPAGVVRNAHKALRPGGRILIGVDCRSVLGKLKFNQYTRRRFPDTILVQAHPFTFLVSDIVRLLERTGFTNVEVHGRPTRWQGFAGKSFHPAFIARKA